MLLTPNQKLINKTKVILRCDFSISEKCKIEWTTSYKVCKKTRASRNNLDCCNKCASRLSNSGSNNSSFKYHKKEDYFSNIDNETKAYLLGWIAADGSIRNKTLFIELHDRDRSILELFVNEISPNSTITKRKNRNSSYLTISSINLINDICRNLNVSPGNKQNLVRIPQNLSSKLTSCFIRGFLEGDGWISIVKEKYITCGIATICPILRSNFVSVSKTLNIKCYENEKGVAWYGKNSLKFLDIIYNNATVKLNRKYDTYIKMKDTYNEKQKN